MTTKFFKQTAALLALTTAVATASQAPVPAAAPTPEAAAPAVAGADNTVIAKVTLDGKVTEITLGQFKERVKMLPPQLQNAPIDKIYDKLLMALVDMTIVKSAITKEGYDKKPDVLTKVESAKDMVMQKAYFDDKIKTLAKDEDLKKMYDEVIKVLPPVEESRIRTIIFQDDKKAKAALDALKKGGNFDTVLADAQKDSANKGGDLGYVRIDDLPAPIAEKVKKAAKATTIPDVIKTEVGFHVVRVDDKRTQPTPTFEQIKDELLNFSAPKYITQVVEGLRKDVKFELFTQDGKPMATPTDAPVAAPAAAAPAAK